jgi:hypothetical protein
MHPGDRFLFYARRVQVLRLENDRDERVSSSVMAWWADLHSQLNIFPKLRRVEVYPDEEHPMNAQTVFSFVTPSLVHLDLYLTEGIVDDEHTQACVPAHLPCLRSLKFWEDSAYILPVGPLLAALVVSARNLRDIQVAGHISVDHISAMSKLENLWKLDMRTWGEVTYPSFQPLAGVFQQLRHWEIHEDNHMLLDFFRSVTPNTRLELFAYESYVANMTLSHAKFDALVDHVVQWSTLVDLSLKLFVADDNMSTCDTSTLLRKLHRLACLRSLYLHTNLHLSLDEDSVCGLLHACLHLRQWRVLMGDSKDLDRRVNTCSVRMPLSRLLDLIQRRPHLVGLPISAQCHPIPSLSSISDVAHPSYRLLEVYAVHDPVKLAELVRSLLPQVTGVITDKDDVDLREAENVRQVNDLLSPTGVRKAKPVNGLVYPSGWLPVEAWIDAAFV